MKTIEILLEEYRLAAIDTSQWEDGIEEQRACLNLNGCPSDLIEDQIETFDEHKAALKKEQAIRTEIVTLFNKLKARKETPSQPSVFFHFHNNS